MTKKSDLPFGSEFSPSQINLPGLLDIIDRNQGDPKAWPISAATFILMYKNAEDPAASKEALKFFEWAFNNGDNAAKQLDFVPLPDQTKAAIRQEWKQIK